MHYVYVLKSGKDDKLYIGTTGDLRRRLREHTSGISRATAPRRPFVLVYYEAYRDQRDATEREYRLKLRGEARRHLKERISRSLQAEK
ncbi:MAG: GIY-YIG nuclease family protein [Patescibacteria group bacterium]|nr:GIY-YIG nuclease family protein [Patescibacteria group bacterium]